MDLSANIGTIKYVGPNVARLLSKKGVRTVEDALYFLPRAYEDRRRLTPIAQLQTGQTATLMAHVEGGREVRQRNHSRFEATVRDSSGILRLVWFRSFPSLKDDFVKGTRVLLYGEVSTFGGIPQITHPDYEVVREMEGERPVTSYHFGRVVPIYSETEGLHQKTIRRVMAQVLKASLDELDEPLPDLLRDKLHLPSLRESLVALHFPKEFPEDGRPESAFQRLAFEEFFVLQLGLGLKKRQLQKTHARPLCDGGGWQEKFLSSLPFQPTSDQRKAIAAITQDIGRDRPMTRLVQGDVGSGKTVVALAAAVVAARSGAQTALMAPTEVLAQQHFRTADQFLTPLGIRSCLFSQETASKKEVRDAVADGSVSLVIGTHAMFQERVSFRDLGLVVVDEQHRFGVEQRGDLMRKAATGTPHLLMMTATPIPRTLALTIYGDLDLTWIKEKPAHRKPIRTRILREKDRPAVYSRIRTALSRKEQVYFIYPLVEDSEKLDLKSATQMHQRLSREVFPEYSVALLHGRMKPEEKERILSEFKAGKHAMLVSTTVIEVGIDVPNATLMIIEHPERLGLSQLHQLRGRVGRGDLESECILLVEENVPPRLRIMEQTEDGFAIAEEDLKFRGPGEFLGTHQSGLPGFRAGHIIRDAELLATAREEALAILEKDPDLSLPENAKIRTVVENRWKEKISRLQGGY